MSDAEIWLNNMPTRHGLQCAVQELAGLEGGRQAAMRALMARCAREEERASAREDERRGERRDSDRRASLAAELPRYDSWCALPSC